jgi:hypothetical protein
MFGEQPLPAENCPFLCVAIVRPASEDIRRKQERSADLRKHEQVSAISRKNFAEPDNRIIGRRSYLPWQSLAQSLTTLNQRES